MCFSGWRDTIFVSYTVPSEYDAAVGDVSSNGVHAVGGFILGDLAHGKEKHSTDRSQRYRGKNGLKFLSCVSSPLTS